MNCNNEKLTRGNDFSFRMLLWQKTEEGNLALDLTLMPKIDVTIRDYIGRPIESSWEHDAQLLNGLVVSVGYDNVSSRDCQIEVTMETSDGRHMRVAERKAFGLVDFSNDANVTFMRHDGSETSEMYLEYQVVSTAVTSDRTLIEQMQGLITEADGLTDQMETDLALVAPWTTAHIEVSPGQVELVLGSNE